MTQAEFGQTLNGDLFDAASVVESISLIPERMTSLTFMGETKRWGLLYAAGRTYQELSDRLPDWAKKKAVEASDGG